ncbi:RES family NAD+ phosphorylase [Spirosoma spitsbergense]|jgi:RES domain-containing protein|uniref:RES family NAD+ phosphorylase n=1 Tax=Spirosoma spitsbergense TaxID=431554 RepID=UPI0003753F53|nr:RES family NAD+ phosphorylase [Spirosoma spitsbergense]
MEVFRVSKKIYQQDIVGTGAYLAGGRWNTAGNYMLYTAASRSLAILEVLIHISRSKPVDDYSVIALYIPDELFIGVVDQEGLTLTWRNQYNQTQSMGDLWLSSQKSVALKVPSAIVKAEYNFLINPNHPAFQSVKLLDYEPLQFDDRFFAR